MLHARRRAPSSPRTGSTTRPSRRRATCCSRCPRGILRVLVELLVAALDLRGPEQRPRWPRSAAPTGSPRRRRDATAIVALEGRVAVRNVGPEIAGEVVLVPGEGTTVRPGAAAAGADAVGRCAQERVHRADRAALTAHAPPLARRADAVSRGPAGDARDHDRLSAGEPARDRAASSRARLLDLRLRLRPPLPPSESIVLVLIDDASVARGRALAVEPERDRRAGPPPGRGRRPHHRASICCSPSPRPSVLLARPRSTALAQALAAPGPAVPADLEKRHRRPARQARAATRSSPARSPSAGNCVLPILFGFDDRDRRRSPPRRPATSRAAAFRVVQGAPGDRRRLPLVATGLLAPLPELGTAASALGHANVTLDPDGAARFELPGDRLRRRRLPVVLARGRAPISRRRRATGPARARPRHRARRPLPADRRGHAPAGQLSTARPLSRGSRRRVCWPATSGASRSRARSC